MPYNEYMNHSFAEVLKELREEKRLTHRDLAKVLNTSNGMISKWEHGLHQPTASSLVQLADYFGITVDYLLGISNEAVGDKKILEREQRALDEFRTLDTTDQSQAIGFMVELRENKEKTKKRKQG